DQGKVFHRPGPPSPRLRTLERAQVTGDGEQALDALGKRGDGPVPLVLLQPNGPTKPEEPSFAPAEVKLVGESRRKVEVEVRNPSPDREALVVFSRPWYPGYRALLDGKPVPFGLLNLTLPAVRVPPGAEGRLVIDYQPRSLVLGLAVSGAT